MDQRVRTGRDHLASGDDALRTDQLEHARRQFDAALLQFRGPELRLGEAHALRGLAEVARRQGDTASAERWIDEAVRGYRSTQAVLDRVDPDGRASDLRDEAVSGECAALVALSGLQLRQGFDDEARRTLEEARSRAATLGVGGTAAGVWATLGRAAMRDGNYVDARASLEKAEALHGGAGEIASAMGCALAIAEIDRLIGAEDAARATLEGVANRANAAGHPIIEGRAVSALAGLAALRGDYPAAMGLYQEALGLLRASDDASHAAYALIGLGDARSRLADGAPAHRAAASVLLDGLRRFVDAGQLHGTGVALLRLASHAYRAGAPGLALACGEASRRVLERTDPTRGVGQALRLMVKAANALHEGPAVLALAWVRADVAGAQQPKAIEVREFYRARAPQEWVDRLRRASEVDRRRIAGQLTDKALGPVLAGLGCGVSALDDPTQAWPVFQAVLELGDA